MQLEGHLVGVDIAAHRVNTCRNILRKYGIDGFARVFQQDGREFTDQQEEEGFDRVLVDAECTHDGSIKHLLKFQDQWGWETFERRVMDSERLATLKELQRSLAMNGFRLLRPGGEMVYSTCSFCVAQNEEIVSWVMSKNKDAYLIPIPDDRGCESKLLKGTLRFGPLETRTSGLYIARLGKQTPPPSTGD
jgi:16S rRNA C967 or C1407 C5-methylase (RsmB/RsmF family)